jgi:flagellar assembly protein FliH
MNMNATVEKFFFDTSFDAEIADEAMADNGPNEPTYTASEHKAAVRRASDEGFARGKREGLEEVRGSTEDLAARALSHIAERLAEIERKTAEARQSDMQVAVDVSATIVHKIVPEISQRFALEEVEGLVRRCMEELFDEPRIVIRLPLDLLEPLQQRLEPLSSHSGFTGTVTLFADEALKGADCRIEWADGGAERDTKRLWREIDSHIERALVPILAQANGETASANEPPAANQPPTDNATEASPSPSPLKAAPADVASPSKP